jgi:hypothetical protein
MSCVDGAGGSSAGSWHGLDGLGCGFAPHPRWAVFSS